MILSVPVLLELHIFQINVNQFLIVGMLHNVLHTLHMEGKNFLYLIHSCQVVLVGVCGSPKIFKGSVVSQ